MPSEIKTDEREELELDDALPTAQSLVLRHPATPTTVDQLAVLPRPQEIALARGVIVATIRVQAIRATHPEDWVLFKSPDEHGGQIVGYLQDAGCDRVRDIYGIEVYNISIPEKISAMDGSFHILIRGDGRCRVSGLTIEAVEGGRSSTDDFCRGKIGADLEVTVRKAARANLDGNVTRALAGMASMPLDELVRCWDGQNKRVEQCRRGRGFGSHTERLGGRSETAPDVDPPTCAVCGKTGVYRAGKNGRGAFYGCPNYQQHQDKKWTVDAEKWIAQAQAKQQASTQSRDEPPPPDPPPAGATSPPLRGDDIFGRGRGREGER